jgi:outer membrane protein TolC
MVIRIRILLALTLCASAAASAQTTNPPANTRSLSMRNCLDLALSHNLHLQIQHLTFAIAGDALSSAYGVYSPTYTFEATHSFDSDLGEFDPRKFNPYFPSEITTENIGSELSGLAPFGFSYDLSGFVRKNEATTDFTSDPGDAASFPSGIRRTNNYDALGGLTMRQHLLKDFWIDSNREIILTRRADLKISQQALRFEIMTTLLAVELAYEDLIDAREEIRVQENALELRRQFVAETQRRVQVGDLPPLDDAQAQTQLQNTLTALAAAREIFSARQNTLIGLLTDNYKDWAEVDVQPTDSLRALPAEVNRSRSFQCALTNRPDLIEARLAVQKTGVMVKFRLNQLFPNLDMVGGYGGASNPTDSSPLLSDIFGFRTAFSFHNPEYSYGVVVSFPLDNITERGNYRASKAAKKIAELQLQKAEQDVLLQVADFVNRVGSSFSQVASTHQARIYAEQALDAETKKFQNGFATSFEVLQFQEILTAARTAEIRSEVDYNKVLAQLAFAEGSILERHHLSLEVK